MKYDIFISYRRDTGQQYARILQMALEKIGYRVFLDYDELTDGVFTEKIRRAVISAPIFMPILSKDSLVRCKNADDWVAKEIRIAIQHGKHFVPVNPDNTFNGVPEDTPEDIVKVISENQHSEILFGQALGPTLQMMVDNRIRPHVKSHSKFWNKRVSLILLIILLLVIVGVGSMLYYDVQYKKQSEALRIEVAPNGDYPVWSKDLSLEQLQAINEILSKMLPVDGDTFMMGANEETPLVDAELEMPQLNQKVDAFMLGKYEVSISEYCRIMQIPYDEADSIMPMTGVSFDDCLIFVETLRNMTNLNFRLPTEAEWEFAARGGKEGADFVFAGSNTAKDVAWFKENSGGKLHKRNDEKGGLRCNTLDLYDMSGNVSEWCDTPFHLYADLKENSQEPEIIDPDAMVIRGGNYDSEQHDITITHREPMNRKEKSAMVGFRLVLDKN